MDSASLQIKFVPLIQALENKSLCLIEILPEISNMIGLENIEWQKTNDQIEYSIPMNYKVILRKVKESDMKCNIETEYNSCMDLLESECLLENNEDDEKCLDKNIDLSREASNYIDLSNHLGNHNLNPMKSNYWDCCNSICNQTLSTSFVYSSMERVEYNKYANGGPLQPKLVLSQISLKTIKQHNKNSRMIQPKVTAAESEEESPLQPHISAGVQNYVEKPASQHIIAQDKETYVVNYIQGLLSHIALPSSKADTDLRQSPHEITENCISRTIKDNTEVIEVSTETIAQTTIAPKKLSISPLCSVNTMPENIKECHASCVRTKEEKHLPNHYNILDRLSTDSLFSMRLPHNYFGMFYKGLSYTNLKTSTPFAGNKFSKLDTFGEENRLLNHKTFENDSIKHKYEKSNLDSRVLPEIRIARILGILEKELLPLKIRFNEVISKCSRLDPIFTHWNKNNWTGEINKSTPSYRQTTKKFEIKHEKHEKIIQSNRVIYTYVFDG